MFRSNIIKIVKIVKIKLENYSEKKLKKEIKEIKEIVGKYLDLKKYKIFFFRSRIKKN